MTIQEVSERYHIPMEILKEYESWEINGSAKKEMGAWQYDDTDLERLSLIISLHDMGFESQEVESYMKLLGQEGTETQRMRMLNKKRYSILDNYPCPGKTAGAAGLPPVSHPQAAGSEAKGVNKPLIQILRRNINENPRQKHI